MTSDESKAAVFASGEAYSEQQRGHGMWIKKAQSVLWHAGLPRSVTAQEKRKPQLIVSDCEVDSWVTVTLADINIRHDERKNKHAITTVTVQPCDSMFHQLPSSWEYLVYIKACIKVSRFIYSPTHQGLFVHILC